MKYLINSYRVIELEVNIAGGSHIMIFPIQAIPVLTTDGRGRLTEMAGSNEENKMSVDAGHCTHRSEKAKILFISRYSV